jgi:hypothetical protein
MIFLVYDPLTYVNHIFFSISMLELQLEFDRKYRGIYVALNSQVFLRSLTYIGTHLFLQAFVRFNTLYHSLLVK